MVKLTPRTVPFRRKREGKTNYTQRLRFLHSQKLRLLVRRTNTQLIAQLVQFSPKGDLVLVGVNSKQLVQFGWNYSCKNLPAAYLTGLLLAKKALAKKCSEAIFDVGPQKPLRGGVLFAFLKGVVDGGLKVPHDKEVFPSSERLYGKHIVAYAANVGKESRSSQFAQYLKSKAEPATLATQVDKVKAKIVS